MAPPAKMKIAPKDVVTDVDARAGWALFGDGRAIPTRFRAEVELLEPRCIVRLDVIVRGSTPAVRAVVVEQVEGETLETFGPMITSSVMRRIALDALLRVVIDEVAQKAVSVEVEGRTGVFQLQQDAESGSAMAWGGRPLRSLVGRGRRTPDELLQKVAGIYRSAESAPTQTVAEELNVSRSHAGRLVAQARAAGHLGATKPGKAGEAGEATSRG